MGWWGVPRAERAERALGALELLHVEHLADRFADRLSGGEARRVHFARALALGSDALLLDEPFAGLDPPTRAELLSDTSAALRDDDRATMVVVHDRAEAWALADRLVVLLDGRVAAQGTPHEVLERRRALTSRGFSASAGGCASRTARGATCARPQVSLDATGTLQAASRGASRRRTACCARSRSTRASCRSAAPIPARRPASASPLRVDGGARFDAATTPKLPRARASTGRRARALSSGQDAGPIRSSSRRPKRATSTAGKRKRVACMAANRKGPP